ncbi:predicted protein [Aspergillus lentulus]|uniref:Uncharacterized protein n=1 Tax=Aspergillus lentulus TaxID=293939 RepID=A0AAN6BL55_ASPLE|nr:uncharacterized protein IFM58399_03308 [Aspergillus lentulus]KAF4159866.1 hypothetical protein CNMCM6069_000372 [Aspergillus lentulus]KAF4166442.1 hypothetical protein CNMCM6936_006528 [Aspergillus lentulus]KAF4173470.1 hypothetical protein CNMCM8060_000121 [Aspergillus lentulus]KAF4184907.1 hypothetical protein CNMCM7927_007419 [Aspergillus lentulus]KAF4193755.1 hypothetical protein CNMCM8694_008445 [Aspergillus lentulus]
MSSYKTVAQEENPSSASPREAEGSRLLDANLESCFKKLLLFPPLLLCNGISLFLITGPVDGWTFKGRQYNWISANRATTQIIVQTLASLLGLTLVATVRSLANFWARNWLTQRPMLLDTVAFFSSVTTSQINWSLRGIRLPALLLTALVALVPAAVWAGAITPILTVLTDETPLSIPTARWTNASSNLWNNNNWYTYQIQGGPRVYSELGVFSYAYHSDRFSYFVNDGSTATKTTESPQRFSKSDNTNFTYYGRSYGMGAAVGLNDSFSLNPYIRSYDYNDTGYLSQYTCDYDTTFAIQLDLTTTSPVPVYYVHLPGNDGFFVASQQGISLAIAAANTHNWAFYMGASAKYSVLNATVCNATYSPTLFAVHVDLTERLITVKPQKTLTQVDEFTPAPEYIVWSGADTAASLSMIGTTSYTSLIGDMFIRNINRTYYAAGVNGTVNPLHAMQDTAEVLWDAAYIGASSAQLVIAQEYEIRNVVAQVVAYRIGQPFYIYLITAINAAALLLLVVEAIRTRFWASLPQLDFADVKSTVVASSMGGTAIAEVVKDGYEKMGGRPTEKLWRGSRADRVAGEVAVMIVEKENSPCITAWK